MKIAYLTSCFGTQSHTFIRREIEQLEKLNVEIALYGIRKDPKGIPSIQARTHYLYPLALGALITSNLRLLVTQPLRYLNGLIGALTSPELSLKRRLKMGYHFLVAAQTATSFKQNNITQVHAHFMNVSASVAIFAAYHCRIPASITVHSAGTFGTPHILGIAQKLKQANHLLMISNYNINYFHKIFPCSHKSTVVRCGMDLPQFPYTPKPMARNTTLKLLAVGRCVEKKGFTHLVEAVRIAAEKNINITLTLIGDGPLLPALKEQAKTLNNITFLGQQPTEVVRQAMVDNDIVVVPSVTSATGEMEGLPVVIMEAMAVGRLVIATQHSGIPEIVINEHTGYLVAEKQPAQIIDAIKTLLERNNELTLIHNARQLIETEFNIEIIADKRKQIFTQLNGE